MGQQCKKERKTGGKGGQKQGKQSKPARVRKGSMLNGNPNTKSKKKHWNKDCWNKILGTETQEEALIMEHNNIFSLCCVIIYYFNKNGL